MIYLVGISISFFLSFLLFSKKGKTQADKILACWLLAIGLHLLLFYLYFSGTSYNYPDLLGLDIPLPLIHGPFLFLYTSSVTNYPNIKKRWAVLHFIPAITCYLYLVSFFALPAAKKVFIFQHQGLGYETFQLVELLAIAISGIVYFVCSIHLLKWHKKSIQNHFSSTEKINLKWLQYLAYGISMIWVLILADERFLFGGVVLFVLFIGYFGIKQVGIFTEPNGNETVPGVRLHQTEVPFQPAAVNDNLRGNETLLQQADHLEPGVSSHDQAETLSLAEDNLSKKKYLKSGLTEEMALQLHERLTTLMTVEKIYTESKISLSELAKRLDTLPNYLSQVINEKEGKNFYDYINNLRIGEFKRLVSDPKNQRFTIESLSYACGFNSKSSFNKNFKKATVKSPSEYVHSLNLERDYPVQLIA